MPAFSRDELEQAFRTYWQTGAVGEDWDAWADLFTEDAHVRRARARQPDRARGDPRLDQADHGAVRRDLHRLRVAQRRPRRGRVHRVHAEPARPSERRAARSIFPASPSSTTPATGNGGARRTSGPCHGQRRRRRSTRTPASSSTPITARSRRVSTGARDRRGRRGRGRTSNGRFGNRRPPSAKSRRHLSSPPRTPSAPCRTSRGGRTAPVGMRTLACCPLTISVRQSQFLRAHARARPG